MTCTTRYNYNRFAGIILYVPVRWAELKPSVFSEHLIFSLLNATLQSFSLVGVFIDGELKTSDRKKFDVTHTHTHTHTAVYTSVRSLKPLSSLLQKKFTHLS